MMYTAALVLAILVAPSPVATAPLDRYPEKSSSQGFHLVVNVTDLSRDLADPVHGKCLSNIHIGPPHNLVGASAIAKTPRVFYQNATQHEFRAGSAQILSDGGSPRISYGLSIRLDDDVDRGFLFRLDAGPGQRGVAISHNDRPYAYLKVPGVAICNEKVKHHGGKAMNVLKMFPNPSGSHWKMPAKCAPVRLLPQCTQLRDPAEGVVASDEFVHSTHCYKNVSSIAWSMYTPFAGER